MLLGSWYSEKVIVEYEHSGLHMSERFVERDIKNERNNSLRINDWVFHSVTIKWT